MRNKIDQVVCEIEKELSSVADNLSKNGAVVSNSVDVFNPGPATTKMNSRSNSPQAVKALYQRVCAKLFKKANSIIDESEGRVGTSAQDLEDRLKRYEEIEAEEIAEALEQKEFRLTSYLEKKQKLSDDQGAAFGEVANRFKEIEGEYKMAAQKVNRWIPNIQFKSAAAYYALLIFIGVCEVPLNKVIFQRFGESDNITLIMAGTLAIAVPVLAHFIGLFWRQRSEIREYKYKAIGLTTMFLATNLGLGMFRADVLTEIIESTGMVMTQEKLYLNIAIFVGITTILFVIGVIAAFLRHDPSWSLEHTYNQYVAYKDKFISIRDEYSDYQNKLKEDIHDYKINLDADYKHVINNIKDKAKEAKQLHDEIVADKDYVVGKVKGMEKVIRADYEYQATSLGFEVLELDKEFLT